MNVTQHVTTIGQSLWLDNLSRSLLRDGALARTRKRKAHPGGAA